MQKRKYLLGAVLFLAFGMMGEVSTVSMPKESTTSAVPEASQSATPKTMLTPKQTTTLTPTPPPAASKEINEHIDRFSAQYGIDPNVLRYMALCESGFNSSAINGPYVGLFQFDSVTWRNIRKEIGEDTNPTLRFAAKDAVQTAAYAISKGKTKLWPNCVP